MTKSKKITLAIAAVVIIGLLVFAFVSGGAANTLGCPDCNETGLIDGEDCETCVEGQVTGSLWALLPPCYRNRTCAYN